MSSLVPVVADTAWLLAPNPRGDAVHLSDTQATLRIRYGAAQVRVQRIETGEGETVPGVVLVPNDSARRLEIEWGDTATQNKPSRVTTRATARSGASTGSSFPACELG